MAGGLDGHPRPPTDDHAGADEELGQDGDGVGFGVRSDRLSDHSGQGLPRGRSGGAGQPGGATSSLPLTSLPAAWLLDRAGHSSFTVDFDHGHFGGGLVDDGLVGGVGGHEGLEGQVVDRSGQAPAGVVDHRDRVVAEKRVGAALLTELPTKYHLVVGVPCGRVPVHGQRGEPCRKSRHRLCSNRLGRSRRQETCGSRSSCLITTARSYSRSATT